MPQPLTLLSFELGEGNSGRRQAAWSTPSEELEGSDLYYSHCPFKQSFHVYPRLGVCQGGPHGCRAQQETREAVTFSSQPLNCWARDILGIPAGQKMTPLQKWVHVRFHVRVHVSPSWRVPDLGEQFGDDFQGRLVDGVVL